MTTTTSHATPDLGCWPVVEPPKASYGPAGSGPATRGHRDLRVRLACDKARTERGWRGPPGAAPRAQRGRPSPAAILLPSLSEHPESPPWERSQTHAHGATRSTSSGSSSQRRWLPVVAELDRLADARRSHARAEIRMLRCVVPAGLGLRGHTFRGGARALEACRRLVSGAARCLPLG
jgi:hypothetical protein